MREKGQSAKSRRVRVTKESKTKRRATDLKESACRRENQLLRKDEQKKYSEWEE